MVINGCGLGYCSRYATKKEVEDCKKMAGLDWNGLCAYQNGNALREENVKDGKVVVECKNCSCMMDAEHYIMWSGWCPCQ